MTTTLYRNGCLFLSEFNYYCMSGIELYTYIGKVRTCSTVDEGATPLMFPITDVDVPTWDVDLVDPPPTVPRRRYVCRSACSPPSPPPPTQLTQQQPQEGVETSTTAVEQPVSDQEADPSRLEGETVDESLPLTANDRQVTMVDDSCAGRPVDVVAPLADEMSPPMQMEELSSSSAGNEQRVSESGLAVDDSADISTGEIGIPVAEGEVDTSEAMGLMRESSVDEGGVDPAVEVETGELISCGMLIVK